MRPIPPYGLEKDHNGAPMSKDLSAIIKGAMETFQSIECGLPDLILVYHGPLDMEDEIARNLSAISAV